MRTGPRRRTRPFRLAVSVRQRQRHPAVLAALLLDAADLYPPDLGGAGHVRPAAGLQGRSVPPPRRSAPAGCGPAPSAASPTWS